MNARPNSEKWMCAGRHALWWLPPWIGAGLDGDEPIAALGVGQAPAEPVKFGSSGAGHWSRSVPVASGGVRLPDLDERVRHGASVAVEHATAHDDALPEGFSLVADRQVVVRRAHPLGAEERTCHLGEVVGEQHQRLRRRSQ